MKSDARLFCLASTLAMSAAACGGEGISGTTDQPSTLAVVEGEIDNTLHVAVEPSSFRLAVVWTSFVKVEGSHTALRIAEDIPVTPSFPAQFQVALKQPPPAEVLLPVGDSKLKGALASLVAYEDTNHNGKLDVLEPDAKTAIDRVWAVAEDDTIAYFEGDGSAPPNFLDDVGNAPRAGFQLWKFEPLGGWACSGGPILSGPPPESCPGFLLQPITTPIRLSLSGSPDLYTAICNPRWEEPGSPSDLQVVNGSFSDLSGHVPDKSDPNLVCYPDESAFRYLSCTYVTGDSVCNPKRVCTETRYRYDAVVPAGWPCPVK